MITCLDFIVIDSASMAAKRTKSRRGGKRPGAGRKPVLKDARSFAVTLDGADYEAISREADERGVSLGAVVREAVKGYVARRRR
jgi:hypothetical protein